METRFIADPIEVMFDSPPVLSKKPPCPNQFVWDRETFRIVEMLAEWHDYTRRGRMARNMQPQHAAVAEQRGSWGVGRFFFKVRVEGGRIFEIYYDRAPKNAGTRHSGWYLYREWLGDTQNDLE